MNKHLTEFPKDKSRKRGHHPYCRPCQNKIKNNKRAKERATKWNKNNPIKRAEIQKEWRKSNLELTRIYKHKRRLLEKSQSDNTITRESLKELPMDNCTICRIE